MDVSFLEIAAIASPAAYILIVVAICVFFKGPTHVANKKSDAVDTIFSDSTDPARFYLIENICYDNEMNTD